MSEEEKKTETQLPIEEESEQEKTAPKSIDDPVELTKYSTEEESFVEIVDKARVEIVAQAKKQQRLSTISMLVVLALCVGGFLTIGSKEYQFISFILLGCALLALIIFSIVIKRMASPDIKTYVSTASTAVNRYVFNDGKYTDCVYYPKGKIEFSEICEDGLYKDIKECVSRDVVEGHFNDRTFKVGELGIYKAMVRRQKPTAFVGKYMTFPNNLHFVDRVVIVSKGATDIDIPDGVSDLKPYIEEEKFTLYAPEGMKLNDVIPTKFIDEIKKISVDNHLLTLTLVIWAGRTVVYASYDDESITLPFYKKIDETCYSQYRDDNLKLLEALSMLLKE